MDYHVDSGHLTTEPTGKENTHSELYELRVTVTRKLFLQDMCGRSGLIDMDEDADLSTKINGSDDSAMQNHVHPMLSSQKAIHSKFLAVCSLLLQL